MKTDGPFTHNSLPPDLKLGSTTPEVAPLIIKFVLQESQLLDGKKSPEQEVIARTLINFDCCSSPKGDGREHCSEEDFGEIVQVIGPEVSAHGRHEGS